MTCALIGKQPEALLIEGANPFIRADHMIRCLLPFDFRLLFVF